ncbi:HNH endonuclease [Streptomyces phage Coruscant]|uniref:HNH endonuclease n=1 Tax=Streptomyces phage Coruscant TaxID=2739834 RepID=A0A7G4AVW4_9CAUD|nr:HNH endonuclease [Streptomyces phage Coruscant]YP_010651613.1 HNH endonuclease [Streptomyces phage Coruscant]QMP84154.1 HNH endonuclease [Streptomyces phage Coruscant]QMP84378.1 HNH endonuclease [Streptomyces phage Coruscant]
MITETLTHKHYANKAGTGSRTQRRIRATVLALAALTGHSDGATWVVCVACGERAVVGGAPSAMDTFNMGHVVADACGGGYCPCNLLPLCRQCNADMGDDTLTDVLTPHYDNRSIWNGELSADPGMSTAPQTNRGRARWTAPQGA